MTEFLTPEQLEKYFSISEQQSYIIEDGFDAATNKGPAAVRAYMDSVIPWPKEFAEKIDDLSVITSTGPEAVKEREEFKRLMDYGREIGFKKEPPQVLVEPGQRVDIPRRKTSSMYH